MSYFFTHLFEFYKQGKVSTLLPIFTAIIQAALLLPIAYFMRQTFDVALPTNNHQLVIGYGASMACLFMISSGLALRARWNVSKFIKRHIQHLRIRLVDTLLALPRETYMQMPTEKPHLLIAVETERQDNMYHALFGYIIPASIVSFFLVSALLWINPLLFSITFICLLIVFVVQQMLAKKSKGVTKNFHAAYDVFYQGIMFLSSKIDLIHNQATSEMEIDTQKQKISELFAASFQLTKTNTLFRYIQENMMIIIAVLLVFIGAIFVTTHTMTIGELISFYLIIQLLRSQLNSISTVLPKIIEGQASLKTIEQFLNAPPPIYTGKTQISLKGNISLQELHFAYDQRPVLSGISLCLQENKCTVLLGGNGSGKSTIISLLQGFYKPDKGNISIEGVPLDQIDINHFRRQIGVVQQQPILFSGSIYENIVYGCENADQEQVARVAKYTGLDTFIEQFPEGYETKIGENGRLLSGGQQQRIALARAIIKEPAVLILDEPTNHLDADSIAWLLQQLKQLPFSPAILLISHNRLMESLADEVYLLQDGITKQVTATHPSL